MKYIICEKPGKFVAREKNEPKRHRGEVLLKINKVGICGTDLHAFMGNQAFFTYPRVLGHELASEVLEADAESRFKPGDGVVIMPYFSCGKCIACRNGKTNCCRNIKVFGVHIDGGMQERVVLPESVLLPAPKLSHNEIAIVEPLAIGSHAVRRANIKKGEVVIVVGSGPIGIGIMKMAQIRGASVIAIDIDEERLSYAKNEIGVRDTVKAGEHTEKEIGELTHGDMAAHVFVATGNKNALETGVNYISPGGNYILVGLSKSELCFIHPEIHAKELSIMCSRNATLEDFENVMNILQENLFPTDSYITHTATAAEMVQHFASWTKPEARMIKVMVDFN